MGSSVVLATAGYDHTIRFWEATSGICYRTLQFADSQVNRLEITQDKSLIAAAGYNHVRLYDVHSSTPSPMMSFEGHQGNVTSVGFARDGKWMWTGGEDGTVRLWDLRAQRAQRTFESRSGVNAVAAHPGQGELVSGDSSGNIRVWDLTANACSCELVPELGVAVRSLSVAIDGTLLVAANDSGTAYVWRSPPGAYHATHFEPLHKLRAHQSQILRCSLSPDVRQLATASADRTVRLWNLDGFGCDRILRGHQRWVWDAVFSVDAAYLVTASTDCTARLWDLASGEAIRIYSGHHKGLVACALNDSATDARDPE